MAHKKDLSKPRRKNKTSFYFSDKEEYHTMIPGKIQQEKLLKKSKKKENNVEKNVFSSNLIEENPYANENEDMKSQDSFEIIEDEEI